MYVLYSGKQICHITLLYATMAIASSAQTLTTLVNFTGLNGAQPTSSLVQGMNGQFYGTTTYGGNLTACSDGCGTVFGITSLGKLTTLYNFDGTDGAAPGALMQATDGLLYGTTGVEGVNGYGTDFQISLAGKLTTLNSRVYSDGWEAVAPLVQATNGNFYGTAYDGGASSYPGYGTVFEMTHSGEVTQLFSFSLASPSGSNPSSGLVQAIDGNLYGTTVNGGANLAGTVYKITPAGVLTTLHNFADTDGAVPFGNLIQATNGNFYGTTEEFGATGNGTVFEMTPSGALTTLHDFNDNDGARVYQSSLMEATDGELLRDNRCRRRQWLRYDFSDHTVRHANDTAWFQFIRPMAQTRLLR